MNDEEKIIEEIHKEIDRSTTKEKERTTAISNSFSGRGDERKDCGVRYAA